MRVNTFEGISVWGAACLLLAAAGCTTPWPSPADGSAGRGESGSGRFDPGVQADRWDDLREAHVSFLPHRSWVLEVSGEPDVSFQRSFSGTGAIWGEVIVHKGRPDHVVRLVPTTPIVISEPFDTVEMTLGWKAHGYGTDRSGEWPGDVLLWLEDRRNTTIPVSMGRVPQALVLRQRHLGHTFLHQAHFPYTLRAIEMAGLPETTETLLLGDISFYTQSRAPLADRFTDEERPLPMQTARLLLPLTTGPDKPAPATGPSFFPSPSCPSPNLRREGPYTFVFSGVGSEASTEYRVHARDGRLTTSLHWNGQELGLWPGLHIRLKNGNELARPLSVFQEGPGVLALDFPGDIQVRISLYGRSLSIRLWGGRDVSRLAALPLPHPFRPIMIPFLNDSPGGEGASVFSYAAFGGLAASVLFDANESQASRWDSLPGGLSAVYAPAADGRHAPFRERIILTMSDDLDAVLPPPPHLNRPRADSSFTETLVWGGAPTHDTPTRASTWVQGADFQETLPQLHEALTAIAITPGAPNWTRDALLRDSAGNWVEDPIPGRYRLKPSWLRAKAASCAVDPTENTESRPVLHTPITAHPPWSFTDYDPRTDQPATFRKSLHEQLERLHRMAEKTGAAIVGDGDFAWWYASGLDAWLLDADRGRHLLDLPFLPSYPLRSLRPYGVGIGLGPPGELLVCPVEGHYAPALRDRYLATHLAYGLVMRLPAPEYDLACRARLYFLSLAVQQARAGHPLHLVGYAIGDQLRTPAQALADQHPDALDQLYLRYANGLELWINGSTQEDWIVRAGAESWVLPPSGWLATGPDMLAFTARKEGHAVAYASTPTFTYWDGAGHDTGYGGIGGPGAYAVKPCIEGTSALDVWDIAGAGFFRMEPKRFGLPDTLLVQFVDSESGNPLGVIEPAIHLQGLEIRGPSHPALYRLTPQLPAQP